MLSCSVLGNGGSQGKLHDPPRGCPSVKGGGKTGLDGNPEHRAVVPRPRSGARPLARSGSSQPSLTPAHQLGWPRNAAGRGFHSPGTPSMFPPSREAQGSPRPTEAPHRSSALQNGPQVRRVPLGRGPVWVCREPLEPGQSHRPQMPPEQPQTPESGREAGQAHLCLCNNQGDQAAGTVPGGLGR